MATYSLPDLAYDYGALEPHISGRIMELHHDKHHRTYVEGANRALEQLAEARENGRWGHIASIERALAFNLSGHVLHSIFWQNLVPQGGGEPEGELAACVERDFGGFAAMKTQLVKASSTIMGSGWGALVLDPMSLRIMTVQIHDHQSDTAQGGIPLLVVDAWEHAYYLQYQTEKARYFEALWNVWNWSDVAKRFSAARELDLCVRGAVEGVVTRPARSRAA